MKDDIFCKSRKELELLQERKLRYFITHQLYPFSPYYRKLFDKNGIKPNKIKTIKDLATLPFTSKADFLQADDTTKRNLEFILQPDENLIKNYLPKKDQLKLLLFTLVKGKSALKACLEKEYKPVFLTATTGTTNSPVSFLYTNYDLENLKIYGRRILEVFSLKGEGRAVNVFPYAPHLAFWQTVFAGFSANIFILSTGGGKTLGTEGNIRSILKVKPDFLIGVPSYVYHILKAAREKALDLSFLKCIVLGAMRVPEGFKRKTCKLLKDMGANDVKILGTYGFTEARSAWGECPTDIDVSSGYHIYPDKEVFEIIDPDTGEVKGEGEDGEIVYSAIDARGSCVFRYRTGDLVKGGIDYSPCPHCRRRVPRLSSDIVRASGVKDLQLSKVKGALVNFNTMEHILDSREEIDHWQVEIRKKDNDPYEVDELVLYVTFLHDVDKANFTKELNQDIFPDADVSFNEINVISQKEILEKLEIETAPKAKKFVDKRTQ